MLNGAVSAGKRLTHWQIPQWRQTRGQFAAALAPVMFDDISRTARRAKPMARRAGLP
jgi:hypothetical protein